MDLSFLSEYAIPVIVGICLCIGYIIKNAIKTKKINDFIPLIMGVLGLGLAYMIYKEINADVILKGLFSGLASTGLFELFKNLINGVKKATKKG